MHIYIRRDKRDSMSLYVQSLKMIPAASSNCHIVSTRHLARYSTRRYATDVGVCSVNDLSAYVLLTSSSGSGKHVCVVQHTEICTLKICGAKVDEGEVACRSGFNTVNEIFRKWQQKYYYTYAKYTNIHMHTKCRI